ncbi:MAG: JDVT-CTERM system CAAX-type protease [Variovorax sp.]|nr:MAG: JDVT-CTERM system CAAX-type protease [Variovorax sp.]
MPATSRTLLLQVLMAGPAGAFALKLLGDVAAPPAGAHRAWEWLAIALLVAPVVEELAFRDGLQPWLREVLARHASFRLPGPTWANIGTSLAFGLCHLPSHHGAMAALVVAPSLLLGHLRERTDTIWPCVLAHAWFNACFLFAFLP